MNLGGFADDETILHELADVLPGVGTGNFVDLLKWVRNVVATIKDP